MAQIDLGRILPIFRGIYVNTVNYEKLDIVYYKGSSYVANSNMRGIAPDSTETNNTWQLVASIDNQQLANVQQSVLDSIATSGNLNVNNLQAGRFEAETIILSGSDLSSTVSAVADLETRLAAAEDKIKTMQWRIETLEQHDNETGTALTDFADEIIALQDRVTALENKK